LHLEVIVATCALHIHYLFSVLTSHTEVEIVSRRLGILFIAVQVGIVLWISFTSSFISVTASNSSNRVCATYVFTRLMSKEIKRSQLFRVSGWPTASSKLVDEGWLNAVLWRCFIFDHERITAPGPGEKCLTTTYGKQLSCHNHKHFGILWLWFWLWLRGRFRLLCVGWACR